MIQQTIDAIDAFESMAPKAVGIFCYDNSSGRCAFASDALTANSLLVGDISWAKEVPQPSRNSWYLRVRDGKRIEQYEQQHGKWFAAKRDGNDPQRAQAVEARPSFRSLIST